MGQPNNERYTEQDLDGARRGLLAGAGFRDPYQHSNVQRLVQALHRWPGISEISLAAVFTPGDFFTSPLAKGFPLAWTHRIPEVIRTATAQGLVRGIPTSHPDYTAYYAIQTTDPEYGHAVTI